MYYSYKLYYYDGVFIEKLILKFYGLKSMNMYFLNRVIEKINKTDQ